MKETVSTAWANRVFGSMAAYNASLPARNWYEAKKGWTSFDRTLGYIEPGTAKRKAEEAAREKAWQA